MNSKILKESEDHEIQHAQQNVQKSTQEFIRAMGHLEEKVGGTVRQVQHAKEVAARPKQIAQNVSDQSKLIVRSYWRRLKNIGETVYLRSKVISQKLVSQIRENPKSIGLACLTLVGGLGVFVKVRAANRKINYK